MKKLTANIKTLVVSFFRDIYKYVVYVIYFFNKVYSF